MIDVTFTMHPSPPLPDVDAALEEIAHANQALHADGFVLMTNYDGVYLGDRRLEPVEEPNRRGAVANLILTGTLQCHPD